MKPWLFALLVPCCPLLAQEPTSLSADDLISDQGTNHSQVMHTLHMLTDRYGPRLTGSPNHEAAAHWAQQQLTDWGLANAHLEGWDFGHPGWENETAEAAILAPIHENLPIRVSAWTPSTKGTAKGPVIQIFTPTNLTKVEFDAWLSNNAPKIKNHIVLIGRAADVSTNAGGGLGRRGGGGARGDGPPPPDPTRYTAAERETKIGEWLVASGALARVHDGAGPYGYIREAHSRAYDAKKAVAGIIVRNEDYGRIARLLADGTTVELEVKTVNRWFPEGKTSYNVIAEIPGGDKADQVVMLGGHLDSWHIATGATDNGTGSAMMMEAVRIIKAAGLKPRRTIRIGLWSGEEEGLLGSLAYVKQHFGTFESPKPEFTKFVTYFNVDAGAGSVRSASVFGPMSAATIMDGYLAPFGDMGVSGNSTNLAVRREGNTDSGSFSVAGLSAVDMRQNPSDYGTTHHTSLDTYERAKPEELIHGATVIADAVWHVANSEETLPAYTKDDMPAPPAPRR